MLVIILTIHYSTAEYSLYKHGVHPVLTPWSCTFPNAGLRYSASARFERQRLQPSSGLRVILEPPLPLLNSKECCIIRAAPHSFNDNLRSASSSPYSSPNFSYYQQLGGACRCVFSDLRIVASRILNLFHKGVPFVKFLILVTYFEIRQWW